MSPCISENENFRFKTLNDTRNHFVSLELNCLKQTLPTECPKKVLSFEKSPKFGYHALSKTFFFILFVNGPKIFGDDKKFCSRYLKSTQ